MVMRVGVRIGLPVVFSVFLVIVYGMLPKAGHRNLEEKEHSLHRVSLGSAYRGRAPSSCRPGDGRGM